MPIGTIRFSKPWGNLNHSHNLRHSHHLNRNPIRSHGLSRSPARNRGLNLCQQLHRRSASLARTSCVMNDDTAKFIAAGPGVVKFAGDWGYAPAVPQGTFVIGRKVLSTNDDAQQIRARGLSPQQGVHDFIFGKENQILTYQSNPAIKYWEGHNEPVWVDEDGMKWYADFEIERMQQMEKLGLKCVIGNYATGTPPENLWPAFLPAVQAALQYGAILGLHEYSCPWMWWMTGRYQVEDENCVDPRDPNRIEGWTTLRYRKVYRQFLEPAGLGNVPLVITEFGLDPGVAPRPNDAPGGAWRNLGGYWRRHKNDAAFDYKASKYPQPADVPGYVNNAQFYAEQLKWIDREMRKDPYVIGATIFHLRQLWRRLGRF